MYISCEIVGSIRSSGTCTCLAPEHYMYLHDPVCNASTTFARIASHYQATIICYQSVCIAERPWQNPYEVQSLFAVRPARKTDCQSDERRIADTVAFTPQTLLKTRPSLAGCIESLTWSVIRKVDITPGSRYIGINNITPQDSADFTDCDGARIHLTGEDCGAARAADSECKLFWHSPTESGKICNNPKNLDAKCELGYNTDDGLSNRRLSNRRKTHSTHKELSYL